MAKRLRRFKFSGLPRLSREQVEVQNALLAHLPQTPFEQGFKDRLRQLLEPLVHADIDLWFDNLVAIEPGELERHICDPTVLAVVGLLPKPYPMLVEVDLTVAQRAIDRLLGGSAEDVDVGRPLSEIEEGVFSFILLKVLQLIQQETASEHQLSLRLNGIIGGRDGLEGRIPKDAAFIAVGFKLFFDLEVGFLRIYLPRELVKGATATPRPSHGPALSRMLRRIQALVPRVAATKVPLSVEVGRIPFSLADLENLDVGDVVLIEDAGVRLQGGTLAGQVTCRVGRGGHGLIQGALTVGETGAYEVAIEQILPLGEPLAEAQMAKDEAEMEEHARALSQLGGGAALAEAARGALSARVRGLSPRPLPAAGGLAAKEPGAEHSDREYEEEGYGDAVFEDAEEGAYEEEPLPEAAGMLEDVAVAMVVELSRVMVSAADVVRLRPGQVIALQRSPGEAVDLVVDGKRIGKGELVEIEGELGVRILELVK